MVIRLLHVFFFTLPFLFALSLAEDVDVHISRIFSILIFFVWAAEGLFRKNFRLSVNLSIFFLFSFLFVASLSFLWADEPGWSMRKAVFLLSYFPLLFVFADVISRGGEKIVRQLFSATIFGAIFASIIALLQSVSQLVFGVASVFSFWVQEILPFFLGETFSGSVAQYPSLLANIGGSTVLRATAFFPDPHIAAYFFGMLVPFAYILSKTASTLLEKRIFLGATLLLLMADFLTFSRGGYVGIVFGGVFAAVLFRDRLISTSRSVMTVLIFVSILLLTLVVPNPVRDRFASSFSVDDGSNSSRIALWDEGVGFFLEKPLLGYGLGNYPLQVKPSAGYREPIYAHNLFLDMLLDVGLFGVIFFLAAIFTAAGVFLHKKGPFHLAALISFVIFCAHSFFETPIFSVHILPLFLLIFSLIALENENTYDRTGA